MSDCEDKENRRISPSGCSNAQCLQTDCNVLVDLDKGSSTVSDNKDSDVQSAVGSMKDQIDRSNKRNAEGGGAGGSRNVKKRLEMCTQEDEEDIIDWKALKEKRLAMFPPLIKNFYQEAPEVANLTIEEVQRIHVENNYTTVARVFKRKDDSTEKIPNPVWKFEQCFAAYPDLLAEIRKQEFQRPSPIQAQAWPILLKGEDLIGIAQTGAGKTLAFLLPAMIHTEYQSIPRSERGGPNILIMTPTRKLGMQIKEVVNKYQFRGMRTDAEIIIGTPERINNLIEFKSLDVATITYVVLDGADRILDSFEYQIFKIFLNMRPDRQIVITSATWPPAVERFARSYMSNPIQVCIGPLDLVATQIIKIMEEDDKFYEAKQFIKNMKPDDKIIIFCSKKERLEELSHVLALDGFMCRCIHGSRDQSDREQAIADITSGEVKILIVTDVVSRDLDIEDITHILNFDFPCDLKEYLHRVGRNGRAGRTVTSISYMTSSERGMASDLVYILQEEDQHLPEELLEMVMPICQ